MYQCILASGSPRRKEILEQCGVSFIIEKSNAEEIVSKTEPKEVVMELSALKASEVANRISEPEGIIIGADTVVADGQAILGKPKNKAEAIAMLNSLQGHVHSVYTGVTFIIKKDGTHKMQTFYEETKVEIIPMTIEEIEDYVASGEPEDKAGSYAIQGQFASYVKEIHGDYYNVVGLPICRIMKELKKNGIDLKKECQQ